MVRPSFLSVHKFGPKKGQSWHCLPKETKKATLFLILGSTADQPMACSPARQVAWRLATSIEESGRRKPFGLVTLPPRHNPARAINPSHPPPSIAPPKHPSSPTSWS